MRHLLIALPLLLLQVPAAQAQVAVNIGINLPVYPQLVLVPDYPVYYAPDAPGNFFFYDGYYWVFEDDTWYYSSWYNGPWYAIAPEYVPVYLLRVPVRYYRRPPIYFSYWQVNAPPRWGDHWGPGWSQRRSGWDHWDRRQVPPPAPLPDYQRRFPQSRYPQPAQQDNIRVDNYRYQPREALIREQLVAPRPQRRGDVGGSDQAAPQTDRAGPRIFDRGVTTPQVVPNTGNRGEVRGSVQTAPPAARVERNEPRVFERGAPAPQVMPPSPPNRGYVRGPERAEPQAPRFERAEPRVFERAPPMRSAEPEQRRPEQRAAPMPQMPAPMQPQMPQPQPRPQFQPPQQPPPQPPQRAEPAERGGPDRMPGPPRRQEDGMRGRVN